MGFGEKFLNNNNQNSGFFYKVTLNVAQGYKYIIVLYDFMTELPTQP